jgi:hypothetical protein
MAAHPSTKKSSPSFFDTQSELEIVSSTDFLIILPDDDDFMGTTTSTEVSPPHYNASSLKNWTKEEARLFILGNLVYYDGTTEQVMSIRVVNRNGIPVPIIQNYDPNRLNVFIDRHVITKIHSMG